jgi:hypothetical protein
MPRRKPHGEDRLGGAAMFGSGEECAAKSRAAAEGPVDPPAAQAELGRGVRAADLEHPRIAGLDHDRLGRLEEMDEQASPRLAALDQRHGIG